MTTALLLASILAAATPAIQVPIARIVDDAKAIDRVAGASKHDMPRDLLRRIVEDDIELMRGHRSDGTYEYASYERMETGRNSTSASIQPRDEKIEIKGAFVYRLVIESPSRRLLVTKNRKVYLDHVVIEYVPERGGAQKVQNVKLEQWLEPGQNKIVDFDEIASRATVNLYARADKDAGYGNISLTLVQARVFDNPDSPYADAVASAKAVLRGLDHDDVPSIRAMATRIVNDLQPMLATTAAPASAPRTVEVTAPRNDPETVNELQAIEDLLTGSDAERRQGLDRLHQLIRKLRPASH